MMTPEDTQKFRDMINKGTFNQASYDKLLKRFELTDIDLESEYTKIVKKESNLSRRKRDLVPDFLAVRDMLKEKTENDKKTDSAESKTDLSETEMNNIVENIVKEKTE